MNKIKQIAIIVLIALTLTFSATLCLAENPEQGVCFGQLGYKYTSDGKTSISASFEGYETIGSGVVICMLYNFDDELADIYFDKISDLSLGYTKTPDVEFEKCRLMLWESLESIKPLCAGKQMSVSDITKKIITVSFDISDVDSINETLPQGDMIYGAKFNLPSKNSLTKDGYVLSGFKVNGEEKAFGDEIIVGEEEITIVPVFSKLITYTIEYYQQKETLDGYTLYEKDSTNTALLGETVSVSIDNIPSYPHFEFSSENANNILSATQTDEGAVLKVYYDRILTSVVFDTSDCDSVNEELPQGNMIYGAKFNLPSKNSFTKDGYVLSGFTVNGEEKAFGEEITVGEEEIIIVPIFTIKLIAYNIEYYRQNNTLDGYTLHSTDTSKSAPEGTLVTIDVATLPTYSAYVFSEDNEGNILSATQTSDGVTLKVYYDRLTVSLECYRHNPYVTGYYLYETKIILAGNMNSVMTVDDLTLPEYPNYSYNIAAEGSIHSGTVTKDGLTLRVYYDLIIDEAAQDEVILRLKRILTDLNTISFTKNERKVLSTVIFTINQTIKDAENGAYIYMEGYVQEYYGDKVEQARIDAEGLKATDEFEPFKSKLGQLRGNDVKFLAKTMLGIDDIDKWL